VIRIDDQALEGRGEVLRAVIGELLKLPADPGKQFVEDVLDVHIESDLHPRLRAVSDLCQNDIAAALHHPQHFRAGLAPVVGVLHPLQTDAAVEVALWNVARVGPGPGSDLTATAALLRDVVVASLVGYVEDL
jgi:hypothetical protein